MERFYWVYILECSDNSYYTGITSDLEKRVSEHQMGIVKGYTHSRRPVRLVYSFCFDDVYDAINAEKQIKGWPRRKKKALIDDNIPLLKKLSNHNKVPDKDRENCLPEPDEGRQVY